MECIEWVVLAVQNGMVFFPKLWNQRGWRLTPDAALATAVARSASVPIASDSNAFSRGVRLAMFSAVSVSRGDVASVGVRGKRPNWVAPTPLGPECMHVLCQWLPPLGCTAAYHGPEVSASLCGPHSDLAEPGP